MRIVELPDRRWFLATLFVPQASSTAARPHPLVTTLVEAAARVAEGVDASGRPASA